MVEVDGYGWVYNAMLNRYYPVVFVMSRDYDKVAYSLLGGVP